MNPKSYIHIDVFREILTALQHENNIMLATIVSKSGSTPAPVLSKMIIKKGGIVSVGTIGGGCMEGEVIRQAHRLYHSKKAKILSFDLNEDDMEAGLICGGSLEVLIEPITRKHIPIYEEIISIRDNGEDCVLGTLLNNDNIIEDKVIFKRNNVNLDEWDVKNFSVIPTLQQSILNAYRKNEIVRLELESGEMFLEPIFSKPRLIVFGGGHVSKFVSHFAAVVGFEIIIVDDREKYANLNRFPEAVGTIAADYNSVFDRLNITPSTYIVIVTRGHKYDEIVLEQALKTNAKYIGMIGSKRKVRVTFEHLREKGFSDAQLKLVHAPIGINIGAATAEEIAVSIVAELICIRREMHKPPGVFLNYN